MNSLQITTYIAAFLSFALAVVSIGKFIAAFFDRHEREWELAQRRGDGKLSALTSFIKHMLLTKGLEYRSVQKMYDQLKIDVVRADLNESAEDVLGSTLWQGLLILLGGALLCLALFGIAAMLIPLILAAAWVFMIFPSMVHGDGEKRSRAIYRRVPYALDLAVLVLQAGGTLREALEIVSVGDDPLADEIRRALKEIDSGATEGAALQHMSQRIGLESLDAIIMAIVRGQQTGAPMAHTLTTQADLFRERRLQELEKLAVEAPTKMTFPNMLVMVSVLVIILGPVLVKITKSGLF
ncbi:MAG TPA: type II secretion system F family protein [Woeseiaceae bacterium]|nr:type II secretion system F family protein [Woeseiaceae bacterium]